MPRKPEPPPTVEIIVDDSPEARAVYLAALKYLVQRIREDRQRDNLRLQRTA